jgi:hypothetical protein
MEPAKLNLSKILFSYGRMDEKFEGDVVKSDEKGRNN